MDTLTIPLLPAQTLTGLDRIHCMDIKDYLTRSDTMYHAVLGDPPYGLSFMGKTWDDYKPHEYQVWVTQWASLLLKRLYPGAVVMLFGGTRTFHRLICGLEDAGFEIADSLFCWTYGSGFPKSMDISKAIDAYHGAEREVIGEYRMPDGRPRNFEQHKPDRDNLPFAFSNQRYTSTPSTPDAQTWDGYGTALKPAVEPIVIARAPRNGLTYAECALQYGTGALNIDGGRVKGNWERNTPHRDDFRGNNFGRSDGRRIMWNPQQSHDLGRWPANLVLTHHPTCTDTECHAECHVKIMNQRTEGIVHSAGAARIDASKNQIGEGGLFKMGNHEKNGVRFGDEGTAARFFYQSKAPSWEREAGLTDIPMQIGGAMQGNQIEGQRLGNDGKPIHQVMVHNPHPTIKPIQLIEYLARILLPPIPNVRLFVPFAGSGSEMIGARLAGWAHVTGVEISREYVDLAQHRLAWWSQVGSYEQARKLYERDPYQHKQLDNGHVQLSLFQEST